MTTERQCVFCDHKMQEDSRDFVHRCLCPNCGQYKITWEALQDLPYDLDRDYKSRKHIISGHIREVYGKGLTLEVITYEKFESFIYSISAPKTLMEKLDKLLLWIFNNMEFFYQAVRVEMDQPAIAYAKNATELKTMTRALKDLGYVAITKDAISDHAECRVTVEGVKRAELLQTEKSNSKRVFVAMWFTDEMRKVFNDHIKPAIGEIGYEPFTIDMKEHNDDICDHIIAEIRQCKFIVADFTGNRGGVYFEAGFGYGLGKPVIWTCRKDVLEEVHFDVNHYNFIAWETGEELWPSIKN